MNGRLELMLLKGSGPKPPAKEPPKLMLLGEGLDAIIQHTRTPPASWLDSLFFPRGHHDNRLPVEPTAEQRFARYDIAVTLYPASNYEVRALVGATILQAWRKHHFKKFRGRRGLMVLPSLRAREAAAT